MLTFPIANPKGSRYDALSVGPEATPTEIAEASSRLRSALEAARNRIDKELADVANQVPGLTDASRRVAELQSAGVGAREDLAQASRTLAKLERKATAILGDYRHKRDQTSDLTLQIEELNSLQLENTETRAEYDRRNPPFELLKLSNCRRDQFARDNKIGICLIRRQLSRFLRDQGEEIYHPTDLTREDFSSDFVANRLLDF